MKLIRNWFVGEGIRCNNRVINSQLINVLIQERAQCELTPLFALNNGHIELSSAEKQNVAKAAKLLSHTTATVLRQRFAETGDEEEANAVADFIEMCNNWFDVFNSYIPFAKLPMKSAFRGTDGQKEALNKMLKFMNNSRGIRKGGVLCKTLATFQQSIIISIKSLVGLYDEMKEKYNIDFICTYKVNIIFYFTELIPENNRSLT